MPSTVDSCGTGPRRRPAHLACLFVLANCALAQAALARDAGVDPVDAALSPDPLHSIDAGVVEIPPPPVPIVPASPPELPAASVAPSSLPATMQDEGVAIFSEVTVRGSHKTGPLGGSELLTSSNVLGPEFLQNQTTQEPLHLLKRVPAVYMSDFNQGVTTTGVGIRGFNVEGEVPPIKLLIDGIPSNWHRGVPELKSVFPLELDQIEVVKGTNDPRYGLYSIAGNVNVETRRGEDVALARVVGGSFGTIEPQLLAGRRSGDFHQTYALDYRSTQGYRENARMQRYGGSAKWFYEPSARTSIGIIARGMHLEAESPGYLRADAWKPRPRAASDFAREDRGDQTHLHVSAHLDVEARRGLSLQGKVYAQALHRDRYVRFGVVESQVLRRDQEQQYGGSVVLTYRARGPDAHGFALEAGLDHQTQDNLDVRANTVARVQQGPLTRRDDFVLHALGGYLQASVKPVSSVKVVAALRADYLDGWMKDRLKKLRYDLGDYGVIWQPKLSAAWTYYEGQKLYANYGRTFQIGTGRGGYQTSASAMRASLNDGWEVGLRSCVLPWLVARVAGWQQLASREMRTRPVTAELEQIGKTNRYGVDLEATVKLVSWLSFWGTFSPVAALQREPGSAYPLRRGKTLQEVPWYTAKGGVDYRKVDGLLVSLWVYAQGDYELTKENDQPRVGAYAVVNLDASYQVAPWVALGLQLQNLLDTTYDQAAWYKDYDDVGSQHSPGPPLSAFASVTLTL